MKKYFSANLGIFKRKYLNHGLKKNIFNFLKYIFQQIEN